MSKIKRRKADRSDGESEPQKVDRTSIYSESWMGSFVTDAIETSDVIGAAKRAKKSLSTIHARRHTDPAFGAAMLDVDRSLDLAIAAGLRAEAAGGSPRAASLYLRRREQLQHIVEPVMEASELDPRIADAMLRAGLDEAARIGRGSER